jgi:hypothetical protein
VPRAIRGDWLKEYIRLFTTTTISPEHYHFWVGATCIASTLKRNVWISGIERIVEEWRLFPNLFVVLVGRPGIGKGVAMTPGISLLKKAGTANILSDRITMEYVLEKLSKGFPKIYQSSNGTGPPSGQGIKLGTESSALLISTELSVFIAASQFSITCLTDLWDSKEGVYQYGTRGKGEWNINEPIVSLIGGSAQNFLVKSIPADAVGGGFTRRVNFVLATERAPLPVVKTPLVSKDALVEDLRHISQIRGQFTLTPAALQLLRDYYGTCDADDFDDEASAVYKASKWANAGKLAEIISISRDDSLVITEEDFQAGIDKVEEVAKNIKIVFRAVGESDLAGASEKVIHFLEVRGFASRAEIMAHNWRHFTSNQLDVVIATFREAGMIAEKSVGSKTLYQWIGDKKP